MRHCGRLCGGVSGHGGRHARQHHPLLPSGPLRQKLTAVAYERKRGRKVSVYMVEVHDDEGKHIADATFTMFYTGATLDDMKY